MSVVAAVIGLNGVAVIADCRVTLRGEMGDLHSDHCAKVLQVGPHAVLGFSGDVTTAGHTLRELLRQVELRPRTDTLSLMLWIPRFLGRAFQAIGRSETVEFLFAGVLADRRAVVRHEDIYSILFRPDWAVRTNHMSAPAGEMLLALSGREALQVTNWPLGVVATLRLPEGHAAIHYHTMATASIGSGAKVARAAIGRYLNVIVASTADGRPNPHYLDFAVAASMARQDVKTVGGLYPITLIDRRGVVPLSYHTRVSIGRPESQEIRLTQDKATGEWAQRNLTTGKTVPLYPPWLVPRHPSVFDDLDVSRYRRGKPRR